MDAEQPASARKLPWMALGGVTLAALLLAAGSSAAVARLVAVPPTEPLGDEPALVGADDAGNGIAAASPGLPLSPTRRLGEQDYRQGILGRNIFDQTKIGVVDAAAGGASEPEVTELRATLIGTVVAEPPTYSAAFIQEDGQRSPWAYGIGQQVQGAEILEIQVDRVRLKVGDKEEWLIMGKKERPTTTASAAPVAAATDGLPIQSLNDNHHVVSRSLLEEKLNDLGSLAREARALLHRGPDGEYDGYRLSAIRRGSLADQLGIKNGDIVHNVNGLELNSMDGAMRAMDALRTEGRLEFTVTRRGQPVTLTYDIQ